MLKQNYLTYISSQSNTLLMSKLLQLFIFFQQSLGPVQVFYKRRLTSPFSFEGEGGGAIGYGTWLFLVLKVRILGLKIKYM